QSQSHPPCFHSLSLFCVPLYFRAPQRLCPICLSLAIQNYILPMWRGLLHFLQIPERLAPLPYFLRLSKQLLPVRSRDAFPLESPIVSHRASRGKSPAIEPQFPLAHFPTARTALPAKCFLRRPV